MALYEDLQWMEDELLEDEEFAEEEYDEELPRRRWGRRKRRKERRAEVASMEGREAVYVDKKKPREKGIRRLKFLAFLETIAILAVLWGWIKWLY